MLAERPVGAILAEHELPGPVSERNVYKVRAKGTVLCLSGDAAARSRQKAVVPIFVAPYPVDFLPREVSLSVNTTAAGGNASLMTIG